MENGIFILFLREIRYEEEDDVIVGIDEEIHGEFVKLIRN
jgi:hypothetical protein